MVTQPTAQLPMIAGGNGMPLGYASSGASSVGMMNNTMGGLNMSSNGQGSWNITQPPNQMPQGNMPSFLPGGEQRLGINHMQGHGTVPNAGAWSGMQGSPTASQQMQASQMQASQMQQAMQASQMQQAMQASQMQQAMQASQIQQAIQSNQMQPHMHQAMQSNQRQQAAALNQLQTLQRLAAFNQVRTMSADVFSMRLFFSLFSNSVKSN